MATVPQRTLEIFYSYSPKDEVLREKLENQLGSLKRQGLITDWHHRELLPGTERRIRVDKHLALASIILLLISPDFIASDYCYSNEMARALEQHNTGKARVIPIILRPTDYEGTPFEVLQALPLNGKAVTEYRSRDRAFLEIVKGIRKVIEDIHAASEQDTTLDISSQEYCHTIYERRKTLDFKGILHVNQNQPISIPLLDVFVPPKVAVGVPEYETILKSQTDESAYPQELREEYETLSRIQANDVPVFQEIRQQSIKEEVYSLSSQEQMSPQENHLVFHLEELYEILPKHRRLVLLGDPGSGKSTLLRYMMLMLAYNREQFFTEFPSLAEEDLVIPLYLPLASYADAWRHYIPGERSLKTFLERYLCENYLEAYSDTINKQLLRGKVLLLFDGLDEIPDAALRLQVVHQVEVFTQAYPTNRFILTSRIVGYRDAPVSFSSGYRAYALAPFDEQQIQYFLQRWCPAYERCVKGNTDQQYLRHLATKEAEAIFQSVHSRPAVRRLASNPLLLTILALLQRQGINLPAHRVELYELCVMTLLDTWVTTRGSSAIATRFTRHELIKVLRPLAFWMHNHPAVSAIPEEELIEQVVKQLLARKIAQSEEEAIKLAEEFLRKVRSETGILIERGKKRYGFLHLTFEEYFAAGELEQQEDREDFIKAHLHDSRWREVILLTIGIPGIIYHKERVATNIVRQAILGAESSFEHWLHRDLLLAGICLADDVGIDMECEDEIIERILCLVLTSPYDALVENISNILVSWESTRLAEKVLGMILPVLQRHNISVDPLSRIAYLSSRTSSRLLETTILHYYQTIMQLSQESEMRLTRLRLMLPLCHSDGDKQGWIDDALTSSLDPDRRVREKSAELFGALDDNRPEIHQRLLDLLSDTDSNVRQAAAKALGAREYQEKETISKLLTFLTESNWRSKQVAVETLGQLGYMDSRIREQFLYLLKDPNIEVRQTTIKVLWQLDHDQPEVIEQILRLLSDANAKVKQTAVEILGSWENVPSKAIERFFDLLVDDDPNVRQISAQALGRTACRQPEIIARLLNLLSDSEVKVKMGAIRALGQTGQSHLTLFAALPMLLSDSHWHVRTAAAEAAGCLGCSQPEIIDSLLVLLADSFPSVRQAAINAFGQIECEQSAVIEKLLDLVYDPFPNVKQAAIQVLGQWSSERHEIIEELLELLSDIDNLTVLEVIKVLGSSEEAQPQIIKRLAELLTHPLTGIKLAAASIAGKLPCVTPEVVGKLLDLLYDADKDVRQAATKALKQLGNKHAEVFHFLSRALVETSGPMLLSNPHVLKGLDEQKKQINRHITLRILTIIKSLGKGHNHLIRILFELLTSSYSEIREYAAESLGNLKNDDYEVIRRLNELLADSNSKVRKAAIKSLGQLGENQSEITNMLLPNLFDYAIDVQSATLKALTKLKSDISNKLHILLLSLVPNYTSNISYYYQQFQQEATNYLKYLVIQKPEITAQLLHIVSDHSADYPLQRVAAKALGLTGDEQFNIISQLLVVLFNPESKEWERESAITALGPLGKNQPEVIQTLLNFLPGPLPRSLLLEAMAKALGQLNNEQSKVTAKLFKLLSNSIANIQAVTTEALGHINNGEPEVIARLFELLSHSSWLVRTSAMEALGRLDTGHPEITEKFINLLTSSDSDDRDAAIIALAKQCKTPMQVMDILLKSLINPIEKRIWEMAIFYILESPQVNRTELSQQIETLLLEHEPITKNNLTAATLVDRTFFALQQVIGEVV